MANEKKTKKSELEKTADFQYRKAAVRYIRTVMLEVVGEEESDLQLYVRSMTWYNDQFEGDGVQPNSSNPPPPPPPPPHG